jgi:hypothetical protein
VLAGIAMTQSTATPGWLGAIGALAGAALILCSFEFVGRFEPAGWTLAGQVTPVAYVVWSLWLIATGIALL